MRKMIEARSKLSRLPISIVLATLMAAGISATVVLPVVQAQAQPAGPTVKIDNFTFGPAALTVKVGTTVTWVNQDDIPHTVVANDHVAFKSKVMDTDDKFSFTFTKAGEYPYFCSLHPHMVGKVIVQG